MSEVINWLTRNPHRYAIAGASVYDSSFETWFETMDGKPATLEEFLDVVAESWDLHFSKENWSVYGGHFVFFDPITEYQLDIWKIEEWDPEDSADFLSDFQDMIKKHWHRNWSCGYGHITSEGFYEVKWGRNNV
ncbi:MAG: hypothetical protein CMN00_02670 [Rickettsiales bacterium]|nr:hypothetical protein [Rickettsiales bacterium]|tara:strand:- start:90 stop:491 length:402 start_codon:yes stop_codon:yes gene_type:complete